MLVEDFNYDLPLELIAQKPADKREESRLLVINRGTGEIIHEKFPKILDYIQPGDCVVMNDSKVIPARLNGFKEETGGAVEFLLIKRKNQGSDAQIWETMVRPGKRLKPGDRVVFSQSPLLKAEILDYSEDGTRIAAFEYEGIFMETLSQVGAMPLPPYIEREATLEDKDRYQTVYCKNEGSVAAPTAGLHFTEEMLAKIKEKGVKTAYLTLHVGIGTFRPVKALDVADHHMHFEDYYVSKEAANIINDTVKNKGRIIAIGTTSVRTMESAAYFSEEDGCHLIRPGEGSTDIFIYPGYNFSLVNMLFTNFHLPKSTLLMLVSAFYNREDVMKAYEEAVKEKYRFFSYGDAMLVV